MPGKPQGGLGWKSGASLGVRRGQGCCQWGRAAVGRAGGRFPASADFQRPDSEASPAKPPLPLRRCNLGPAGREKRACIIEEHLVLSAGPGEGEGFFVLKCAARGQTGEVSCCQAGGEPSPPGGGRGVVPVLRARWTWWGGGLPHPAGEGRTGRGYGALRLCYFQRQERGFKANHTEQHCGLRDAGPSTQPQPAVRLSWGPSGHFLLSPERSVTSAQS